MSLSPSAPATTVSTPAATTPAPLTRKDFASSNEVRWCPGCGDYAILNALQRTLPELGVAKENFVVVSGIGCSSRFPYYMNTYGFHTIHGRAPSVATGVKVARPDLDVWLVTGDGDGLSIGGNHMLHLLRRNVDIKVLLFNNRIYGLTKGQYSPTTPVDVRTKSAPLGAPDHPLNPILFALGSEATFVARTVDSNVKHLVDTFKAAHAHRGVAFIEIMQNCVIFNDGTWDPVASKGVRDEQLLPLEIGKPLRFGKDGTKGLRMNGFRPEVVTVGEHGVSEADLLVHDPVRHGPLYAEMLARLGHPHFPTPIGVLWQVERPTYEAQVHAQNAAAQARRAKPSVADLLADGDCWDVKA